MRLRILKDTATVGRMLTKGSIVEVQAPLAEALLATGKAEDAFKVKAPKATPEKPQMIEVVRASEKEEVNLEKRLAKKPAKKKAARKPAKKAARKKAK